MKQHPRDVVAHIVLVLAALAAPNVWAQVGPPPGGTLPTADQASPQPAAAAPNVLQSQSANPGMTVPPGAVAPGLVEDEPNRQDELNVLDIEPERPGFWDGVKLNAKSRTYFFSSERDQQPDNEAWAVGGALEFRSGWGFDRFQVGATVFTSQKLHGPEDKDGTQLLKPGQESFTVLGEAYLTTLLGAGNGLRIGRQPFELPYLARGDSRMVPNTFEAVAIGRPTPVGESGLIYIAGYVDRIKRKNDDKFIPMSEAAGAAGSDKGMAMAGAQYTFADGSLIAATNQATIDVMNTFFIKGEKSFEINDDLTFRAYAQYTDQRNIGDDLIGEFATHLVSIKGELFYPDMSFRVAASKTGDERGIQSPYGGAANYLSIIVDSFHRAGEEAYMVGMSHDLPRVEGMSASVNIAKGHTPDNGPFASPDEVEYDLTVDYNFPKASALNGLRLRMRGAWIDQDEAEAGGDDFFNLQIIANYTFNLL